VLDATPPLFELKALRPDLTLLTFSVADGAQGTERVFRYTSDATRRRLLPDHVINWERFEKLLRDGLERAAAKQVRRLLLGSFKEIIDHLVNRTAPASVLGVLEEWRKIRALDFAYYGNVRGLDTWLAFDGFLSIGDHHHPVHETQAIARELGIDDRALGRARARAESAQFHGRARDPGRATPAWHCHIGACVPEGWPAETEIVRATMGRPKTEAAMTAEEFVAIGKALGWTERSAAAALGVSRSAVQWYRSGGRTIPADVAERARALRVATKVPSEEEGRGGGNPLGTFVARGPKAPLGTFAPSPEPVSGTLSATRRSPPEPVQLPLPTPVELAAAVDRANAQSGGAYMPPPKRTAVPPIAARTATIMIVGNPIREYWTATQHTIRCPRDVRSPGRRMDYGDAYLSPAKPAGHPDGAVLARGGGMTTGFH
jgi:hypothetical protein